MREKRIHTLSHGKALILALLLIPVLPAVGGGFEASNTDQGLILKSGVVKDRERTLVEEKALRNPFRWPPEVIKKHRLPEENVAPPIFENLQLTGIIWDEIRPVAIIDGTIVGEGDQINGSTVLTIFRNEVLLEQNNQHHFLKFKELLELEDLEVPSDNQIGGRKG